MDNRPVGVFDSGVGGVSVLQTLRDVLPDERYLYYGDTKNAPYGDRDEADILSLVKAVADGLIEEGVKALVIACNTATSAAAASLRAALPIPVIGMEPALKPAALEHIEGKAEGKIVVMATAATLKQTKFAQLMALYGQDAMALPCPGLMEFVERGELNSPALLGYLREKFDAFRGEAVDAVVLGCTHYVFLKDAIRAVLPGAALFDGNLGTANRLKSILMDADRLAGGPGSVAFDASDPASIPLMHRLFGT